MDAGDLDIMEPLDEKPSMEGEATMEALNDLERKEKELLKNTPPVAREEDFVEGVVEDGFGLLRDDYEDNLFMPVKRYTFTNKNGMTAQLIDFGVTITSIRVPDKKGVYDDVVLGFDHLNDYLTHKAAYIGSTIGRVCNRVSRGRFLVGSKVIDVTKNVQGSWQLHGGHKGLSFVSCKQQTVHPPSMHDAPW